MCSPHQHAGCVRVHLRPGHLSGVVGRWAGGDIRCVCVCVCVRACVRACVCLCVARRVNELSCSIYNSANLIWMTPTEVHGISVTGEEKYTSIPSTSTPPTVIPPTVIPQTSTPPTVIPHTSLVQLTLRA